MLAGMARITISLTVILIECTNDVQYSVAIMIAVMCAKWVGDLFNHGLYDIHIHLKHVPLLEPFSEKEMFAIEARHVMSQEDRVETLDRITTLEDLVRILTETKHSMYPVVLKDGSYVGMLKRDVICALLHGAHDQILQVNPETTQAMASWDVIQDQFPTYPDIAQATQGWMTDKHRSMYVNLLPYANTNAFTVQDNTCMQKVYTLFRGMGLRCLPVLGLGTNRVVGTITRQDLLGAPIEKALGPLRPSVPPVSNAPNLVKIPSS